MSVEEPAAGDGRGEAAVPVSAAEFKRALGRFGSGVVVLTLLDSDDAELGTRDDLGMTATAFTSVSVEPPLVLVAVAAESYLTEVLERQDRWAVTILGYGQKQIAGRFALPGRPSARILLEGLGHHRGERTGAMIPEGGLAALECRTDRLVPAGDHMLAIGEVLGIDYVSSGGSSHSGVPDAGAAGGGSGGSADDKPAGSALIHFAGRYHRLDP